MDVLKNYYKDYFRVGVACERIHEPFVNNEIGNPDKEALILKHFNSMTCANELKPAYNMAFRSERATEEYLPFEINPLAKEMLTFAKTNNMPVRGHVMVWHSQCSKEVFCKGYEPVTIPMDPEILKENPRMKMFEKLDPVCYVDRETMLKRLKSYITELVEYMYAEGYATTIYAWDVVNEAIELADKTPTGLRNTYWYQVIGEDFIYYAFRYAYDAVAEMSVKYAAQYGVDPEDTQALSQMKPKLFYNDYNEWMPDKKAAIIAALERSTEEHGSVLGEQLIDGIGMQGHLSDNNDIPEYIRALKDYSALVNEVHIAELDVKCTCTNKNAFYYQAVFYKKFFEELLAAMKEGAKLTSVTFWGLTDDNSWIRDANPLLFDGKLQAKKAYDAVVYALTGGELGEPEMIEIDLRDRQVDFSGADDKAIPEDFGFKMRGFGELKLQKDVVRTGDTALANPRRFGEWSGIAYDISDFIGQTIEIRTWVKSSALEIALMADVGGKGEPIAKAATAQGDWVLLEGRFQVPADLHSAAVFFAHKEVKEGTFSELYVDSMEIKLVGLEESFENDTNIAAIRGVGHLPLLMVTDKESVDGKGHSLRVTRQEKDATMKFNASAYIGYKTVVSAYVKTKDKVIRLGLDGATAILLSEVNSNGDWTRVSAEIELEKSLKTAQFYIETDGNADFYVDDIFVTLAK